MKNDNDFLDSLMAVIFCITFLFISVVLPLPALICVVVALYAKNRSKCKK